MSAQGPDIILVHIFLHAHELATNGQMRKQGSEGETALVIIDLFRITAPSNHNARSRAWTESCGPEIYPPLISC